MRANEEILTELAKNQRKNIPASKRLQYTDLKRISKNLSSSIFEKDACCIWNGYITNINNVSKGVYINFYFRGKKYALHRLLFINYIDDLRDDEYIKFSCHNKGKCCNIYHLVKYKYVDKENIKKNSKGNMEENKCINIEKSQNDALVSTNDFIINF